MKKRVILIKFGGSVITDKKKPRTFKKEVVDFLVYQLKKAKEKLPDTNFIVGNGAGSFGHYEAKKYGIDKGILTEGQIYGLTVVQDSVASLNRKIVKIFLDNRLPAVSLHPSSIIISEKGRFSRFFLDSLFGFLKMGIIPVLYGDVVYDKKERGKIFSTEKILSKLALILLKKNFLIQKIINIIDKQGVYDDKGKMIKKITQDNFNQIKLYLKKAEGFDVTGGMISKVNQGLKLAKKGIKTVIVGKDDFYQAIFNDNLGTVIE